MPGWRLHPLKGARRGHFAVTVSGNWRITFLIKNNIISDLNFEDYH